MEFKIPNRILLVASNCKRDIIRKEFLITARDSPRGRNLQIPYSPPEKKQSLMKPELPFSVNMPIAVVSVEVGA
jgi:hypothetical protein